MNSTMEEKSLPWVGTDPYPWRAVVPDQLKNKSMEKKAVWHWALSQWYRLSDMQSKFNWFGGGDGKAGNRINHEAWEGLSTSPGLD